MWEAEDGVCIKRKLLVFNDVFQPLTDSIQPHRPEIIEMKQQQESVLLSFVCVDGTELFMGSLTH